MYLQYLEAYEEIASSELHAHSGASSICTPFLAQKKGTGVLYRHQGFQTTAKGHECLAIPGCPGCEEYNGS